RSRSLLVLGSAYLFTSFMAVAHALTFPGLFSETGLLSGPQTTAWMYMFWHSGFSPLLILYARIKDSPSVVGRPQRALLVSLGVVVLATIGFTLLATAGHALLPEIMSGNGYRPLLPFVVGAVWALSMLALAVLWWHRPHTVLDLWLMVVM